MGDFISLVDGGGIRRVYRVQTITDNLNVVLATVALSVAAGVTYSQSTFAGIASSPDYFVGNNALQKAFIIQGTARAMATINTSIEKTLINADEGILIESIYIRMPYQYTLADTPLVVQFLYLDSSGALIDLIRNVGEDGFLSVPIENVEVPVNAFVPTPITGGTARWQINARILNADLFSSPISDAFRSATASQMDADASFNNVMLPIFIGIRIAHVTPLDNEVVPP